MSTGQQTFDFVDAQMEQADYRDACREYDDLMDQLLNSVNWSTIRRIEEKLSDLARWWPEINER